MMVYFDTNVLIYAFTKNIDSKKQKDISIELVERAIENNCLVLSELTLCEFAFVSHKTREEKRNIDDNLEFLSTFLRTDSLSVSQRIIDILRQTNLYNSSFDVCHLAFSEQYNAKLITFDKGFKKLQNISKVDIEIK